MLKTVVAKAICEVKSMKRNEKIIVIDAKVKAFLYIEFTTALEQLEDNR